jgi:hypothetical protein
VYGQVANVLIRKTFIDSILSWRRLTNNRAIFATIAFEVGVAAIVIYSPGLNGLLGLAALPAEYALVTVWYPLFVVLYDEARKWIVRSFPNGPCAAAFA